MGTFHFHLLVAAWGSVPTSQGLVPVQGSVLTNPGFHPRPMFRPYHLWSMTTLSLLLGGLLVGVVSMRGKGHWLGVGGVLEYTRNPESPPLQIDNPIFFLPWTELVKFFVEFFLLFSYFFLTSFLFSNFCSKYGNFLPTCIFLPFFLLLGLRGLSPKGGHCHEPRWVVSHITPVTLL